MLCEENCIYTLCNCLPNYIKQTRNIICNSKKELNVPEEKELKLILHCWLFHIHVCIRMSQSYSLPRSRHNYHDNLYYRNMAKQILLARGSDLLGRFWITRSPVAECDCCWLFDHLWRSVITVECYCCWLSDHMWRSLIIVGCVVTCCGEWLLLVFDHLCRGVIVVGSVLPCGGVEL